jgi:toxin-antitoxin system PIN domain toxin
VKVALLDLNILTALLWPTHEHHGAAHRWFAARGRGLWATCNLTQLGFVRLVTNPAFSSDALSPAEGTALLRDNLNHPQHEFWGESLDLPTALRGVESRLQGYRQVMDAYLLATAERRHGVLATFDRGLRTLAGADHADAVEVVSTR